MGKIEERLEHLKSDIEELRITADKSHISHQEIIPHKTMRCCLD